VIRDLLGGLDYSVWAQIALAIFFCVFVAAAFRVVLAPRDEMDGYAALPLADCKEASDA
jgi:hypothetical protein